MKNTLLSNKILPLAVSYLLLIGMAILADYLLHRAGFAWMGRYLGIGGALLILLSFIYSLRKRKIIQTGSAKFLLGLHEKLTWAGAMMILIHSGIHFNALLPWLAAAVMMLVVASGHVGKFLLKTAREELRRKTETLTGQGLSSVEVEKRLFWDSLTVQLMNQWRMVHVPMVMVFVTLAILHILSILFFWTWK